MTLSEVITKFSDPISYLLYGLATCVVFKVLHLNPGAFLTGLTREIKDLTARKPTMGGLNLVGVLLAFALGVLVLVFHETSGFINLIASMVGSKKVKFISDGGGPIVAIVFVILAVISVWSVFRLELEKERLKSRRR